MNLNAVRKYCVRPYLWLWIEFVCIGIAIAVPIALMNIHLIGTPKIFSCLSTAFLISLPFIFLPSRWRPLSLIPVWLIAVFYLTNTWYWRFFKDFIPLQNFFLIGNFDSDLFRAGADMVKPVDIMLALPAICLTLAYIFGLFKCACSVRFSKPIRTIILSISLASFFLSEYSNSINEDSKFINISYNLRQLGKRYFPDTPQLAPWVDYNVSGLIPYLLRGITRPVIHFFQDRTISNEDVKLIEDFHLHHKDTSTIYADTIIDFFLNQDKNLIFIVVESLNAWVVDYEYNGRKVMPVLSGLICSDGSISSCEMVNQTHSGISSDGQFIYNTGLYAASDVTTVSEYLDNDLPSLAKILKPRKSFEIICESPNMWNHIKSNKAYGFDDFIKGS